MRPAGRVVRLVLATALMAVAGHAPAQSATAGKPATGTAASNAAVLELLREIDGLKREVQSLRGQIEDRGHEIEQLRRIVTDLDQRVGAGAAAPLETVAPPAGGAVAGTPAPAESSLQVETQTPAAPAAPEGFEPDPTFAPPTTAAASRGAASASTPPGGSAASGSPPGRAGIATGPAGAPSDDTASEAAYREAFGLLRAAAYDKAVAAFVAFQARYPDSQYGDSAQYWLAEALAANGKHDKAAAEYQKLMVQFPSSKKLPYAMLKLGDSYDKLGKTKEAKAVWAELRKQFPSSAAAKLAEQRPGVASPAR